MKNLKTKLPKLFSFSLTTLFFFSCGHHRDVRPGTAETHSVQIVSDEKIEGAQEAMKQAKHFCKSYRRGSFAAVIDEKQNFLGADEYLYNQGRKAGEIAREVGPEVGTIGTVKTPEAGILLGLGGYVAKKMLTGGYQTTLQFSCRN